MQSVCSFVRECIVSVSIFVFMSLYSGGSDKLLVVVTPERLYCPCRLRFNDHDDDDDGPEIHRFERKAWDKQTNRTDGSGSTIIIPKRRHTRRKLSQELKGKIILAAFFAQYDTIRYEMLF